jgi:hypothetical protein
MVRNKREAETKRRVKGVKTAKGVKEKRWKERKHYKRKGEKDETKGENVRKKISDRREN